jgi:hypothetical protein
MLSFLSPIMTIEIHNKIIEVIKTTWIMKKSYDNGYNVLEIG